MKLYNHYEVLISCPSDVEGLGYPQTVDETLEKFNREIGEFLQINLESKFWKKDTYGVVGISAQDAINNQLVTRCDICVAIFYQRFGTPTEKFLGATEEEILNMANDGKPVFVFFIKSPTVSSDHESMNQYTKLLEFMGKIRPKSLYTEIENDISVFSNILYQKLKNYYKEYTKNELLNFNNVPLFSYPDFNMKERLIMAKHDVFINGITINVIIKFRNVFESLLKHGVKIKILTINKNASLNSVLDFYFGKQCEKQTYNKYAKEIINTYEHLKDIPDFQQYYQKGLIEFKSTKSIISTSFIGIDLEKNGQIQAVMYQYKTEVTNCPAIYITKKDNAKWFENFHNIIKNMWNDAIDVDIYN